MKHRILDLVWYDMAFERGSLLFVHATVRRASLDCELEAISHSTA